MNTNLVKTFNFKYFGLLILGVMIMPSLANAQSAYEQPQLGKQTGLYRLYNQETKNHLFTVDYVEAFALKDSGAYVLEGTVGNVFTSQVSGSIPLHRLYNIRLNKHAFVIGTNGLSALKKSGYKEEAVIAYIVNDMAARASINGASPTLYWLVNSKTKDYFFTSNADEATQAGKSGYKQLPGTFYIF